METLASLDLVLVVYTVEPSTEGVLSTHIHGHSQSDAEVEAFMSDYIPMMHPGVTSWQIHHIAR